MNTALTLAIIELILKFGPQAAISLLKGLKVDDPTPEQIRSLKVKDPSHYFKD